MSERFKPFGKPAGSAAGCKAFNDAVSANESQAQTYPQKKTQPLTEMSGYETVKPKPNFGDYRGFSNYLTILSTRSPMIGNLNFSC
jgi:hypothetical protein